MVKAKLTVPHAPWLTLNNINLSSANKDILTAGDELTNKHIIDFAQAILKK